MFHRWLTKICKFQLRHEWYGIKHANEEDEACNAMTDVQTKIIDVNTSDIDLFHDSDIQPKRSTKVVSNQIQAPKVQNRR